MRGVSYNIGAIIPIIMLVFSALICENHDNRSHIFIYTSNRLIRIIIRVFMAPTIYNYTLTDKINLFIVRDV